VSLPNYQTVTSIVRSLLDESEEPTTWKDGKLTEIANEAQRKVVGLLGTASAKLLEDDVSLTIPAGTLEVTFSPPAAVGTLALPDELLFPMVIRERLLGATTDYGEPLERRRTRLSTNVRTEALHEWMWKGNRLRFIGATTDRDIQIEYRRRLPFLLNPNDPLLIPGSENAIAWRCVMNAEYSRGNRALQDRAKVEFNEAIKELRQLFVLSMQNVPVRRRPYGYGQCH